MQITRQRIRLAIDTAQMGNINDVLTGASPQFWNGVDLQFELGIFRGAQLADIANLDSITIDLKPADSRTGLPLMSKTLGSSSLNQSLTLDNWNAGDAANCHALIQFTHDETNLDLADDQVTFWLVISALTGDTPARQLVLGATPIVVIEGGEGVAPPASVVQPTYYTAAQSDARYQQTIDLTSINNHLTTLDTEVGTAQSTADAALPKSGGTMTGNLTLAGLSGVLNAASGVVSGSATTDNLPEGANQYFTNARADARITAQKGAANGLCPLDAGALIPVAYLPALAISETFVVNSQSAMLALTAQRGDIAIRTDLNQCFILATDSPSTLADWKQLLTPPSAVTSVNSQTGAVTLTTSNITEGSNLYYTIARVHTDSLTGSLTGFSSGTGGAVSSGDSILSALGKLENRTALNDAKITGVDRVKLDGTTPMTGALSFTGTTHAGVQLNNLNSTQVAALTPADGMLVYNTTASQLQFYNGAWQTLGGGAAGGSGTTWLNGSGAPSSGLGNNGDYYVDTATGNVYLKSSGTWSIIVAQGLPLAGGTLTGQLTLHALLRLVNYNQTAVGALAAGAGTAGEMWFNTSNLRVQYMDGAGYQTVMVEGLAAKGQLIFDDSVSNQIVFGTNNWRVQSLGSSPGGTSFSISPWDSTSGGSFRPGFIVNHDGSGPAGTTISLSGSQTLGPRKSGWTAATGTATRSTFATSTVTLSQLAEHVKALLDDLISHGLIGS